jgi:hypothetical protein
MVMFGLSFCLESEGEIQGAAYGGEAVIYQATIIACLMMHCTSQSGQKTFPGFL